MMNMIGRAGPVKVSGRIRNYKVMRKEARFVFADDDKLNFGALAVAAGLVGLGGQAVALAGYSSSMEELADYLEFEVAGEQVKGWVWRSPFEEGDVVEVVGQRQANYIEVAGIVRPADRTIALYPHCSRGSASHRLNSIKWWLFSCASFNGALFVLLFLLAKSSEWFWDQALEPYGWIALGASVFMALMIFSLNRKWMPYVRVAERVFHALGLPKASWIDLVKSSSVRADRTLTTRAD